MPLVRLLVVFSAVAAASSRFFSAANLCCRTRSAAFALPSSNDVDFLVGIGFVAGETIFERASLTAVPRESRLELEFVADFVALAFDEEVVTTFV